MAAGDSAYIKRINRSLIIEKIIKEGLISRANLSKITHLTRATISTQVADLLEEGLIVETEQEHLSVGRKPIMLSLNGDAGYALGIDLDFGKITFSLADLTGNLRTTKTIGNVPTDYQKVLHILVKEIKKYKRKYSDSRYGIVGVVIGIHGLVASDEVIHYVPRFGWHDIHLKENLEQKIDLNIFIENNANLAAFAERVFVHHDTDNLISASFYSGIGLGIMIHNEFFRGNEGFAGEAGHMIVVPRGVRCDCGNFGCWEQYCSERSFFKKLGDHLKIHDISYEQLQEWFDEKNEVVIEQMDEFLYYLAIGLNNMINLYNPDVLVLDSEILKMYPDSISKIKKQLTSSISHYRDLSVSTLGKKSCIMGACALAIKHFLDVPMLNFTNGNI
jgi:predicted NBD/HSP70 family sugar kinase